MVGKSSQRVAHQLGNIVGVGFLDVVDRGASTKSASVALEMLLRSVEIGADPHSDGSAVCSIAFRNLLLGDRFEVVHVLFAGVVSLLESAGGLLSFGFAGDDEL